MPTILLRVLSYLGERRDVLGCVVADGRKVEVLEGVQHRRHHRAPRRRLRAAYLVPTVLAAQNIAAHSGVA